MPAIYVLWFLCTRGPSSISIPNFKWIALLVRKLLGGPKISKLGHVTRPRSLRGRFIFHTQEGFVLHLCTKVEADCSFRWKVIKGSQNLEIKSRDPGHAHLLAVLWSLRREGLSSMTVPLPNFKQIALFVQKLLGGSQNFEIGHVTLSHAPFEP